MYTIWQWNEVKNDKGDGDDDENTQLSLFGFASGYYR